MTICEHTSVQVWTSCQTADDPREEGAVFHSVHIRAACEACGTPFRFLGDMAIGMNTTVMEALAGRGPWVTGCADEMGVLISPIELGGVLETVEVEGRA